MKNPIQSAKIMLLVVENRFSIPVEYAKFLVDMAWLKKMNIMFWRGKRRAIWWTRRRMIENFLSMEDFKDYTHIMFLDTDNIPCNADFLEGLVLHDKPIVTGYYCDTTGKPCSYANGEHKVLEGLQEVEWASMGFSLIRRDVLENVQYPEPIPTEKLDADVEFFAACRKAGYTIYQDFNQKAHHLLQSVF